VPRPVRPVGANFGCQQVHLPTLISNPACPLTKTSVRRSTSLNKSDGFCAVQLDREPAKKRKISIIHVDEHTGKAGPVPLSVLQEWGIDCGLSPSELSNDALMHDPSVDIPDENADDDEATL
jgi:hypothetical protein